MNSLLLKKKKKKIPKTYKYSPVRATDHVSQLLLFEVLAGVAHILLVQEAEFLPSLYHPPALLLSLSWWSPKHPQFPFLISSSP